MKACRSSSSSRLSKSWFIATSPGTKRASIASPEAVNTSRRWRRGNTSRRTQALVSSRAQMPAVVDVSSATSLARVTWAMPGRSCNMRRMRTAPA